MEVKKWDLCGVFATLGDDTMQTKHLNGEGAVSMFWCFSLKKNTIKLYIIFNCLYVI